MFHEHVFPFHTVNLSAELNDHFPNLVFPMPSLEMTSSSFPHVTSSSIPSSPPTHLSNDLTPVPSSDLGVVPYSPSSVVPNVLVHRIT